MRRRDPCKPGPRGWHRQFRHSLHKRLVAIFLMLALGTAYCLFGGVRVALSDGYRAFVKPVLSDYIDRLAAEIGSPPDTARAQALTDRLPIAIHIDGPAVHWSSAQWRRMRSDRGSQMSDDLLVRTTADGHRIEFGVSDRLWHGHHPASLLIPLAGLLLLTFVAYVTARRLLRPLDDIRSGAMRYGAGDFDAPIPVRRRDELGDLATQVNDMARGLQGMLQGQRALLLAISHELRSPITRARLHAELSPESPERTALLRELALMGELVTDLLEGERLAAGAAALQREQLDFNTLVREVIATQFAELPLQLDLAEDLPPLWLDRTRALLLIRNLIDNACRHGQGAAEPVQLCTRVQDDRVEFTVRDHGPGVAPEHLARLGEPFYRPDSARTRSAGGVGLGLYLCRLVAQSHGGRLDLAAASPGLQVTVRWPV